MIRLKDIAERAGVSIMSVSKALRDAPDISDATKARIRQLARQMGYVPDSMAQGLRSRRTKFLGVVISSTTNPIFARTLLAIEERAHEVGYDLVLSFSHNVPDREEASIRRLLARRVDGLIISPVYRLAPTAPVYEDIRRRGTPTVILGHCADFCGQFVNVESDDIEAGSRLTRHLLELGHKRIAFLSGPPGAPWAQERFDGYCRALREAQLEIDDRLVFNAGSTIEEGEKAALQMLNEGVSFTALQAANDLVAIGAANVFLKQGWKIPEDLSITGFGNILLSEHFRVPLTTVRQPKLRLGSAAMDLMTKMLLGKPVESLRLSAEIIVRNSTAEAREAVRDA